MSGHEVSRSIRFCYGHRILGHTGGCEHMHGHNARVEIRCAGPLDEMGMVVDFAEIRRVVESWIQDHWDHRMLLRRDDPMADVLRQSGEPIYEMDGDPTAENMAACLFHVAREGGLPVVSIRFWETSTSMAAYTEP